MSVFGYATQFFPVRATSKEDVEDRVASALADVVESPDDFLVVAGEAVDEGFLYDVRIVPKVSVGSKYDGKELEVTVDTLSRCDIDPVWHLRHFYLRYELAYRAASAPLGSNALEKVPVPSFSNVMVFLEMGIDAAGQLSSREEVQFCVVKYLAAVLVWAETISEAIVSANEKLLSTTHTEF